MLCAKCHEQESTAHFTAVVDGKEGETVRLCGDCAAASTGFDTLDPKEFEALSVIGKKCEFCGKKAFSGQLVASGRAIYWCFDCGLEFGRIFTELLVSERPDLLNRGKEEGSFLAFCSDPELQAWSEAASQRALKTLKERRRQNGHDQGS